MDAQGSLTASMGYREPDELETSLANILDLLMNDENIEIQKGILHHEENIDLMPGNIELSGLEVMLVNVMNRERVLQQYIELVKEQYDYVLLDCMPSLGMLTINAFACADSILIPVQAAYLPRSVRAEETSAKGMSIYRYDPNGKVSSAYNALTLEVFANE